VTTTTAWAVRESPAVLRAKSTTGQSAKPSGRCYPGVHLLRNGGGNKRFMGPTGISSLLEVLKLVWNSRHTLARDLVVSRNSDIDAQSVRGAQSVSTAQVTLSPPDSLTDANRRDGVVR